MFNTEKLEYQLLDGMDFFEKCFAYTNVFEITP